MERKSKPETPDHWKTSDHSRRLCDLMLACLPSEYAPKRLIGKKTCGVDVLDHRPALYWLYHSKDHVRVYPYGKFILGLSDEIQNLLPIGVVLQTRPSLGSDRARLTPCFFVFQTEEQARGMGPLLKFLSDYRFSSSAFAKSATNTYWRPLSEAEEQAGISAEEGDRIIVLVNKYERDKNNRARCIEAQSPLLSLRIRFLSHIR